MNFGEQTTENSRQYTKIELILRNCSKFIPKQRNLQEHKHPIPQSIKQQNLTQQNDSQAKQTNLFNDSKYFHRLYENTKKRKQMSGQIRKTELGENIKAFDDLQIVKLVQQYYLNGKKSTASNIPITPTHYDLRISKCFPNLQNEVVKPQRYPQLSMQISHLQQIRKELVKNEEWAKADMPEQIIKKKKTKFLNFSKKVKPSVSSEKDSCSLSNIRGTNKIQRHRTLQGQKNNQGQTPNKQQENQGATRISLESSRKQVKPSGILKKCHSRSSSINFQKYRHSMAINQISQTVGAVRKYPKMKSNLGKPASQDFANNYIDVEKDIIIEDMNNLPQLLVESEKNIELHKLPSWEQFMHWQQLVREKLNRIDKDNGKKTYYTKNRLQALYQSQMLKIGKKVFGSRFYLQSISSLLTSLVKKTQKDVNGIDKRNIVSNHSSHKVVAWSSKKFPHRLSSQKISSRSSEINEAELMLEKNKERIREQRKRVIYRLRC